MVHPTRKTY